MVHVEETGLVDEFTMKGYPPYVRNMVERSHICDKD